MKKDESLIQALCLPYCRYYKQGKNEELLCMGAVVVKRLMQSGRQLSGEKKHRHGADRATIELMVTHLCSECDFRKNDCDFARDREADPCGGFELLTALLSSRVITIEDIGK
ncbi:MAG: hypothetical protein ACM3MD_07680 [Betaproteobacteria bacterium]